MAAEGADNTQISRVETAAGGLPPPNALEAHALARIGAPIDLRLACQLRPTINLSVVSLLHPRLAVSTSRRATRGKEFGEEQPLTVLFIDLRGFTRLAEARLPYDVVFLLNHYFAGMAEAIERTGGHCSNFTGDGLMALFGLDRSRDRDHGAGAALTCALHRLEKISRLNQQMASELAEAFIIGIGIHTGPVIVGLMGPPRTPILTALGDVVNTAARLEGATKEMKTPVVASFATLDAAGVASCQSFEELLLKASSHRFANGCNRPLQAAKEPWFKGRTARPHAAAVRPLVLGGSGDGMSSARSPTPCRWAGLQPKGPLAIRPEQMRGLARNERRAGRPTPCA